MVTAAEVEHALQQRLEAKDVVSLPFAPVSGVLSAQTFTAVPPLQTVIDDSGGYDWSTFS